MANSLNKKLTDRKLSILFGNICDHYNTIKIYAPAYIQEQLQRLVDESSAPGGMFEDMEEAGRNDIQSVLDTFLEAAIPVLIVEQATRNPLERPQSAPPYHYTRHPNNDYWRRHHHHPTYIFIGGGGEHRPARRNDTTAEQVLIVAIVVIVAGIALGALYYLTLEALNSFDRILNNEGMLQGVMSLMSMVAASISAAILSNTFLIPVLVPFFLAAGFSNPVGWAILSGVLVAGIGTAVGYFLAQTIQDYVITNLNTEALDPTDPYRFTLTLTEEKHLEEKGFVPIKVKCAIAALHAMIEPNALKNKYSLFSTRDQKTEDILEKVRYLRQGLIGSDGKIDVADMYFNLRETPKVSVASAPEELAQACVVEEGEVLGEAHPEPSAPSFQPGK